MPRTFPRGAFCQLLGEMLHQPVSESVSLFDGLEDKEVQRFLRLAAVHGFRAGETILREGDAGHEMFIMLSGAAEALASADGQERSLQVLGPGSVFGEMALFNQSTRTARVVSLTDCEVLVLTRQMLESAMTCLPETAAKIMFNLVGTLCERLRYRDMVLLELS